MGVEHFLVDYEGRHVLDCHKWYELSNNVCDWDNITRENIETAGAADYDKSWIAIAALAWMDEFTGGRPIALRTDGTDCQDDWREWVGHEMRLHDGWTLHETHGPPDDPRLYRPPAVAARLAELRALWAAEKAEAKAAPVAVTSPATTMDEVTP